MRPGITIREEADVDVNAITEVAGAAFKTLAISKHTEQFIVEALRAANALKISLVAEVNGRVVGHIALSPVTMSDGAVNWYGLGRCRRRLSTRGRALAVRWYCRGSRV